MKHDDEITIRCPNTVDLEEYLSPSFDGYKKGVVGESEKDLFGNDVIPIKDKKPTGAIWNIADAVGADVERPKLKFGHIPKLVPTYAIPVDIDENSTDRDKANARSAYFTKKKTAKMCYSFFMDWLAKNGFDTADCFFLEPGAGSGVFLNLLKNGGHRCRGVDIVPCSDGIDVADFLWEHEMDTGDLRRIVLGNPPFGKNSAMAHQFFHKYRELGFDVVGNILPRRFQRGGPLEKELNKSGWFLHEQIDLSGDAYEFPDGTNVTGLDTIFAIYARFPSCGAGNFSLKDCMAQDEFDCSVVIHAVENISYNSMGQTIRTGREFYDGGFDYVLPCAFFEFRFFSPWLPQSLIDCNFRKKTDDGRVVRCSADDCVNAMSAPDVKIVRSRWWGNDRLSYSPKNWVGDNPPPFEDSVGHRHFILRCEDRGEAKRLIEFLDDFSWIPYGSRATNESINLSISKIRSVLIENGFKKPKMSQFALDLRPDFMSRR